MELADVSRLIAAIKTVDPKMPATPAVATGWHFLLSRVPFEIAIEAVRGHYTISGDTITPAQIVSWHRAKRREEADREYQASLRPPHHGVIDSSGEPVGDDPHWGRQNSMKLEQLHADVNRLAPGCTDCGAEGIGRCRNTITGNATKIPHPKRLVRARVNGWDSSGDG